MKRDIHFNEPTYKHWKETALEEGIDGLSKTNSKWLLKFLGDMEIGQNVGKRTKKGARSYGRLNVLRQKLGRMFKLFEQRGIKDIITLEKKQEMVHQLFDDLEKGKIKRLDNNQPYTFVADYTKNFKVFWNWYMKINRKNGKFITDITEDLSTVAPEIKFVYLTKEQVDEMLPYFKEGEQQVLIKFLYDSIIRWPTECLSLRVKDVYEKNGDIWINIPDEVSKTYGRTFNLLYCGDALKSYIRENEMNPDDLLFGVDYRRFNAKLRKVAKQVFGDKISHPKAKDLYSNLTGYDFRHCGAIHLRQLAQKNTNISLDAIRQRAGWKDFDMLNYYTQFLGLTGEIKKEDLLITEDKTKMQQKMDRMEIRIKRNEALLKSVLERGSESMLKIENKVKK